MTTQVSCHRGGTRTLAEALYSSEISPRERIPKGIATLQANGQLHEHHPPGCQKITATKTVRPRNQVGPQFFGLKNIFTQKKLFPSPTIDLYLLLKHSLCIYFPLFSPSYKKFCTFGTTDYIFFLFYVSSFAFSPLTYSPFLVHNPQILGGRRRTGNRQNPVLYSVFILEDFKVSHACTR